MKKFIKISVLFIVLLMVMTGCTTYDNFIAAMKKKDPSAEIVETIKIGVMEPLSGADASLAADEIRGIELAHELFPQVLGKDIELVYADNQSDAAAAKLAAKSLIDQGCTVVLGSYRNILSLSASEVFEEACVPAITISCTNPIITNTNQFYSRVCYVDAYQGKCAAQYVCNGLQLNKVAVLRQTGDELAAAMIEELRAAMEACWGDDFELYICEFSEGEDYFIPYFSRFAGYGAECVFFPSSAKLGAQVILQSIENGYFFNWLGTSQWVDILGEVEDPTYFDGVSFVTEFDAESTVTNVASQFLAAYRLKYGDEAPAENVALGFDAYLLAREGIERAGRTDSPAYVGHLITKIRGLEGASGMLNMTANGDPTRSVLIEMVIDGTPVAVYSTIMEAQEDAEDEVVAIPEMTEDVTE